MKQLILILALLPLAGFGQTKNVLKGISTNALTEPLVVPTGKSITIDSGATITNNGTATGFGGAWGSITGTLSAQTDLQSALDAKLASATAASTYQLIIGDGDLTIARTSGLQTALDAKQPLAGALTTLSSATAAGLALMDDADAAAQRTTLGLVIGTNVQAYDADLTTYAGITPSANVQTLLGAADFAAVRTALSLGAAALLEVSTGGNAASDQDKLARYQNVGELAATTNMIVYDDDFPADANKAAYYGHNSVSLPNGGDLYVTLQAPGNSATLTITMPSASGTLIGTGNLTSITALGTVTAGTWQADDIALAYLAQGGATDGQAMVWDNTAGTWEPGTISTGLTIGTTTTSGASAGDILTSDGSLMQKLTPGTGVSTWLATPTKANLNAAISDDDPAYVGTNNTFTGQQIISLNGAANAPPLRLTGTWSTAGTTTTDKPQLLIETTGATSTNWSTNGTGLGVNAASGSAGNLIDLQTNGTNYFKVSAADGTTTVGDGLYVMSGSVTVGLSVWNTYPIGWLGTATRLYSESSGVLQLGQDLSSDAADMVFKSPDAFGATDKSGGDMHLKSGLGTGAGAVSALIFSTPAVLASGTTSQSYTERARINSSGLAIGSGGSAISKVLTATATLNFDLTALVVEDLTVTCTGAAVGDSVFIGVPNGSVTTSAQFTAWVSAADTVTVRCRTSVVGEDPASGTFRVDVHQH